MSILVCNGVCSVVNVPTLPRLSPDLSPCPGSRGSHTMIVVLDETGMKDVPAPIVVQEYCNHGALLFKVRTR